jgi:hypothetical protein
MGLTITFDDTELPVSPAFISFLHGFLTDTNPPIPRWYAQEEEELLVGGQVFSDIQEKARVVMSRPDGVERVVQSYRYFKEMLIGRPGTLQRLKRFSFFFVIGIPRSGGTYITKQLFRAIGLDYTQVQTALAHDGFPNLALFSFEEKSNLHTNSILQLAEYLTMVEIYFTKFGKLAHNGAVVVPKKFTKAVYNFPLIKEMFGNNAYYLITLRHPLSMIRSTLEKSKGLPPGGRFAVRSTIEQWALQDWRRWGTSDRELATMSYFEVMLGYWKRYHYELALVGLPMMPTAKLITYGKERMTRAAETLFAELGVNMTPEEFKVAEAMPFERQQVAQADLALDQVARFWRDLGLTFPHAEIAEPV